MKFYEELECEHGWTDDRGFSRCDLGTGCSVDFACYCTKEDCPIYEEDTDVVEEAQPSLTDRGRGNSFEP